ncbi:NUDIX domain-containing protein [Streptomyces durbertensis]|uniref:NUDIX domain-containing protein n=1 Tax=Streptomyces durbertensis TaxID=2448886 RepID=A0ABR6EGJ9_9ACTN|nr:NUDIX domain-containing protein [Streptomyces durbertensis]MBB1244217.1 NUDIX domain-containing protein [Streptomyces durbertensis]
MTQPTTDDRPEKPEAAPGTATPLLVAAVIVHDTAADRVVLLQRGERAKFAKGRWDLPIGKSEPGEPITETAVRELYEETGLTVEPEALDLAHVIHGARGVDAPDGFLTVVFVTHEWSGELENREPGKHAQVRWFDVDAIPDNLVGTTSSAARRYFAGGPKVSLHGWE